MFDKGMSGKMSMATRSGGTINEDLVADWLAAYVDALIAGSENAPASSPAPDEAWRRQLARLAMALHATLAPVVAEPAFRAGLSRRLTRSDLSAGLEIASQSPRASRWVTVAVAGSVVSAVGLAWAWRHRRPAA